MMCSKIGRFKMGAMGFARSEVKGLNRVPLPPAMMTAFTSFSTPLGACDCLIVAAPADKLPTFAPQFFSSHNGLPPSPCLCHQDDAFPRAIPIATPCGEPAPPRPPTETTFHSHRHG